MQNIEKRGHLFIRFSAVAFLAFALACRALGAPTYSVRTWQTDDGLPQNSVRALAQTHDGYLWVGTQEGLARFDGARFLAVDEREAPELKRGWITALCVAGDGNLWVACDGVGVARMRDGKVLRLTEKEGLPSNQPRCLLEAKDGSIWIGSEGGGLSRYKEGKLTNFSEKSGLANNSVAALCEDRQGNLRIATKYGLSTFDQTGIISTIKFGSTSIPNALRLVAEDQQGAIWVASNERLIRMQGEQRAFYGQEEGLPDKTVNVVLVDHSGTFWAGTYRGLARWEDGRFVAGPRGERVFGDLIYTMLEDQEQNLWAGGRDGLYRLNPARFTSYTAQQGLTHNNVMSVCEDQAGDIWIGTWGGGLDQLKGETVTHYSSTNGLTHDTVLSLLFGREGELWVGMDFDGGLNRLDQNHRNTIPNQRGLNNAAIRAIYQDNHGTVWLGTKKGLFVRDAQTLKPVPPTEAMTNCQVYAFCHDSQDRLWIGTDAGLSCWKDGKFTLFTTKDGLSHNAINALYEDREKILWIGTRGGGLNRFNEGRFTGYTTRQGLFNDEIYEILEDDFGYFWMSCRSGIFRIKRKLFDELDRRAIKVLDCTAFGISDGMASVQCNGVAKPAGWKGRDGRLWFPTIRGVVAVDSRLKINERLPPVVIEEVLGDDQVLRPPSWGISSQAPLKVPAGGGGIEVHFTALSLQASEKNRFKCMLEGFDPGWFDAGPQRFVRYNHVGPGSYHFRVIGCNNDGVWNTEGATLTVVFLPHYWQTWWFKLAIAAVAALILTAIYRSRVARLREIERLRVDIAANLHDDVGARLTKVAMVTESVNRDTPENDRFKPHLQSLLRTTREIIQAMDEIVWTINPKNDTLDNLANYIFQYAQDYFQDTAVRCRLDVPAALPDVPLSTEQRHNFFMAVKEALNNVLKHARASEVRLSMAAAGSSFSISVADNGCGFDPAKNQMIGNGLQNMKQRIEGIGGQWSLESQPGCGTRIRMELLGT